MSIWHSTFTLGEKWAICGSFSGLVCVCVRGLVRGQIVFYLHIVAGMAPIPLGIQVAQTEALQLAQVNLGHRTADLPCHKIGP